MALVLVTAPALSAQQSMDVSTLPMVVGPGTQGFVSYRGPAIPNFFWFCDDSGGVFTTIGEIAEEVHMLQAGDLASITFAYHVQGAIGASGTASANLRFYANNANDSISPPAGLIASYTVTGLPWSTATNHTATFDVPSPVPVPQDLWVGIEIVSPSGTAGSVLGASPDFLPVQNPAPNAGSSHNLTWFGPSTCTLPPGELLDNSAAFGIVANYTFAVRIFPEVDCEYELSPNGDFEAGSLTGWTGAGRRGVVTAEQALTVPPSGAFQGYADTGLVYPSSFAVPALTSVLEPALGVPSGTLGTLAPGGPVIQGSALTRTVTANAGDILHFAWNFQTSEPTPIALKNDFAFLTVSSGGSVVFATKLADTFHPSFVTSPSPYNEETGYQPFNYAFPASGTYTIGFGVVDRQDSIGDSALLVDCVELEPGAPLNQPPTCTSDLTAARQDFIEVAPGAFVVTEGATLVVSFEGTDPDGDALVVSTAGLPLGASVSPSSGPSPLVSTLLWTPTASDKAGAPYTIGVTFQDPAGDSSSCSVTVADVNLNPVCTASDQTVESTGSGGATVTLDGSATDADDPPSSLVYQWFVSDASVVLDHPGSPGPTGVFPIGVTMATLSVADGRGGVDVHDVLITVQDTQPPEVMCTSDVAALWPPNHAMSRVQVYVTATDACAQPGDILPIHVTISSNEPDDATGNGDGNTTGDVSGQNGYSAPVDVTSAFAWDSAAQLWRGTVYLRAERAGAGNGRKYTLDVSAMDSQGNAATTSCCVIVPHDRRGAP